VKSSTKPLDLAARLDREADALLFLGFRAKAEHLAHRAEGIRQTVSLDEWPRPEFGFPIERPVFHLANRG
jgi:hypothetical protein